MQRSSVAAVAIAASVLGGAFGCGPSLRLVAQSRVYFERCYAADFDPRIPVAEQHACWTAWRQHYTSGQPPDRVQYAVGRLAEIEHGVAVPGMPGLPEAAIGPRAATPVLAVASVEPALPPEPPPPTVEAERPPRRERPRPPPVFPRVSNRTCAMQACEPTWRTCAEACPPHDDPCATACTVDLQACSRGCF